MGKAGHGKKSKQRVGIVYDQRMCEHESPNDDDHPENPKRIRAIWKKLVVNGIPQRCVVLSAKEAEEKHVMSVHSKTHVSLIKNVSSKKLSSQKRMASKLDSIYFNKGSSESAFLAAGSVIEVVDKVAKGELDSAFAIVRPPGHHAEHDEAMGFCLFNNVAIAASFLLNDRTELGIKKILIVDWDVHHGNGTQKMFYQDPRVLVFSVHRHDFGTFYPGDDDGNYTHIGEGPGKGYNINIPWEKGGYKDVDYMAVWDHILIPIVKEFDPDFILISAGFDAADGDPIGECCVTPCGYSLMLKKLKDFAKGKIVLALEGGYNLESTANSVLACIKVLLQDKIIAESVEAHPSKSTLGLIQAVIKTLGIVWPTLGDNLPMKFNQSTLLPSGKAPSAKMSVPANQLINQHNKRKRNEGHDKTSRDSNPKDRGGFKFFEDNISFDDGSSNVVANEGSNQKRQTPVSIIEPNIIACMPLQQISPAWEMVESTEAFQKIPQAPHFYPLAECRKVVREGTTFGLVATNSNLFEEISALRLDDPTSVFTALLEDLGSLKDHGFDITELQCRIHNLLSTRDAAVNKQEKLNDKIKEKDVLGEVPTKEASKKAGLGSEVSDDFMLIKKSREKEENVSGLQELIRRRIEELSRKIDRLFMEMMEMNKRFDTLEAMFRLKVEQCLMNVDL